MRFSLNPHLRWTRSTTTSVGLVLVGILAFVGLAVGASPYALITLVLLGAAVLARSDWGSRGDDLARTVVTVEETPDGMATPDLAAVLHTIALQVQTLTAARYVALGIGTDPEKPFEPWVSIGMSPDVARALGRHPRPIGTLGQVACAGDVLRTADIRRHASFHGFPAGHPAMSSFLGVPIRYRGRPAGNLYLADKRGAVEFSEQDERLVIMLAARAGVAIETTRMYVGEAQRHLWLRNTIDQMPEGVLIVDRDGRTVAVNRALHAFLREHDSDLALIEAASALDVRYPDGAGSRWRAGPPSGPCGTARSRWAASSWCASANNAWSRSWRTRRPCVTTGARSRARPSSSRTSRCSRKRSGCARSGRRSSRTTCASP